MDGEVELFEQTILDYADAFHTHGAGAQPKPSFGRIPVIELNGSAIDEDEMGGENSTPEMSSDNSSSTSSSRSSFSASSDGSRRSSFVTALDQRLTIAAQESSPLSRAISLNDSVDDIPFMNIEKANKDAKNAWRIEAAAVDRSVHILPGVRKMIDSIPAGRYAVATSGAKTYGQFHLNSFSPLRSGLRYISTAYGCMTRVGITPPPVTITADDKRLKAGKPFPDPFLLAAECLGFDAKKCVVFEDSPSGIKAGVASGATVIAVCTSHPREKIENCGAHYLVSNMESIKCEAITDEDGNMKLEFTIEL